MLPSLFLTKLYSVVTAFSLTDAEACVKNINRRGNNSAKGLSRAAVDDILVADGADGSLVIDNLDVDDSLVVDDSNDRQFMTELVHELSSSKSSNTDQRVVCIFLTSKADRGEELGEECETEGFEICC